MMTMKSSKRHVVLVSLIFLLKCLSKSLFIVTEICPICDTKCPKIKRPKFFASIVPICHILETVKKKQRKQAKIKLTTLVPGFLRRPYKSLGLGLAKVECAEIVKHLFQGVQINTFKIAWIQA